MNDVVVRPEGPVASGTDRRAAITTLPGGSGANQAAWLAAEGVRTRFAGRVGAEDRERQAALLASAGVEPRLAADPECPTGMVVALIADNGERSFLTDRGANARLTRSDIPDDFLDAIDHVHVSGYALFEPGPRAAVLELLDVARGRGLRTSVDPGSHGFLEEVGGRRFLEWTDGLHLCFPNAAEAAALTGTEQIDEQLRVLTGVYDLVIIKRGTAGAVAAEGERRWSVAAPPITVLNTSGAGDAFLAGFLAHHLHGCAVEECLQRGVELGARAAAGLGARPARSQNGSQQRPGATITPPLPYWSPRC